MRKKLLLTTLFLLACFGMAKADTPIHSVNVNGYVPPVAGENSQNHLNVTIPSGANYFLNNFGWFDDDANDDFSGIFVAGTYYSLGGTLKANDGYYFADDCVFSINGRTDLVDDVYSEIDANDNTFAYLWSVSTAATGGGEGFDGVVQVGSGTASASGLPIYSNWKYGLTQQIYTASEIGKTGTITSIGFYATQDMGQARTFDIYLVKTSKSSFDDAQDYISASESDKVFSGTVTFAVEDWTTLEFDTPFSYDGSTNLCLIVNDKTGSYNGNNSKNWLVYSSTNQSIWRLNDSYGPYDPASPKSVASGPTPDFVNYKSQLQLTFNGGGGGSGTPIHSVYVNGYEPPVAGENSQNHLNLTVPSDANYHVSWSGWWNDDSSDEYVYDAFVAGTRYSLNVELKANDGYYFADDCTFYLNGGTELVDYEYSKVSSDDNTRADLWSVITAATAGGGGGTISAPASADFETGDFSQIAFENDETYPWIVTSDDAASGTYCMMSGNSDQSSTSSAISVTVNYASDGYITFDAKCMGEGENTAWDKCIFYIDGEAKFTYGAKGDTWDKYVYFVTAGTHTFKWEYTKDSSINAEGDAFFVDNIEFGYGEPCIAPSGLEYNLTASSATLTWKGYSEYFSLRYRKEGGDWQYVNAITEKTYTLTDLAPGVYEVEVQSSCNTSICSGTFEITEILSTAEWCAYVTYSMDGADWANKFISFSMKDVSTVQAVSAVFPNTYAATYVDGYVWFITQENGNLCKAPLNTGTNNLGDYEVVVSEFETEGTAIGMAYNVVDGKIYYLTSNNMKSFNPNDPSSVSSLPLGFTLQTFAINKDGEAYGITAGTVGKLYRVSLTDASTTLVGETGIPVNYVQSMAFDMETDELFWAQIYSTSDVGIYKVNTSTAAVAYIGKTGTSGAELTGLFMLPPNKSNTTNLAVTDIQWNSATVTWESSASAFNLQYKPADSSEWTTVPSITTTSYTLTGLQELTTYNVRVQAEGGDGWVSTTFTTPARFLRPTDIQVLAVTPYTAALDWTDNCGASAWQIAVDDISNTTDVTRKPFILTGLTPDTGYYFAVRAVMEVDGETFYSPWSEAGFFTTPVPNPSPEISSVIPTPNSATITWEGQSDSYKVRYRESASSFFEDFEGLTEGALPEGWIAIDSDGDGFNWSTHTNTGTGNYTTHSGDGVAISASYDNNTNSPLTPDNWLITPKVTLGDRASAWLRGQDVNYAAENFAFYVSTTDTDPNSFTQVSPEYVATGSYTEYTADLSAYAGQEGYVAIRHYNVTDMFVLNLDDFSINGQAGEEEEWTEIETTEKSVTIEGLTPDTDYEYEVIGIMQGQPDASSSVYTFNTLQANPVPTDVVATPAATTARIEWTGYGETYRVQYRVAEQARVFLSESFESGMGSWTTENLHSNSGISSSAAYTGSQSFRFFYSKTPPQYLISPELSGITEEAILKFQYRINNTSYPESFMVGYSTTTNSTSDFTWSSELTYGVDTDWHEFSQAVPAGTKYIAIQCTSNDQYYLFIDDINVSASTPIPAGEWQEAWTNEPKTVLTGLEKATIYDFKIASYISGVDEFAVTDIMQFTTKADISNFVMDNNEDNSGTITDYNGTFANVTIQNLTIESGKWQGICLPFDVDVEYSPLAGADVRTFESRIFADNKLFLNFLTPVTEMKAGTPYIVKTESTLIDPVFENVTIKSGYHDVYIDGDCFASALYYYFASNTDYPDCFKLTGSTGTTLQPLLTGDILQAFEAYIVVNTSGYTDIYLNTGEYNDLITGLKAIDNDEEEVIYNVAGQRLAKKQKGVNIVNGKKVLVK